MITTTSDGSTLTSAFNYRIDAPYLDIDRVPDDVALLCREVSGVWYTRDISALWVGMSDVNVEIGNQPGVSVGGHTSFLFDNSPLATLKSKYTTGQTLDIKPQFNAFSLAKDDWLIISDNNNTEIRRCLGAGYDSAGRLNVIAISRALDADYDADETTVKFAYILDRFSNQARVSDQWHGCIKIKSGFADLSEYVTVYQGEIIAARAYWQPDPIVEITTQTELQKLVDYEFTDRIEWDDRGLASVPYANTANGGNGTISDITYLPAKDPDVLTTENWTLTYSEGTVEDGGETKPVGLWEVTGSVSGTLDADDETSAQDDFLPQVIDDFREGRWVIDVLAILGWSVTIEEGDVAFEVGDKFHFSTQASGTVAAVVGTGAASTINTTIVDLKASTIIKFFFDTVYGAVQVNPETGTSSTLYRTADITALKALPQDIYPRYRGRFDPGTKAVTVLDDMLKLVYGWAYPTHDNRIGLTAYSALLIDSPTDKTLSFNRTDTSRVFNVVSCQRDPFQLDSIANLVKLEYGVGQDADEGFVEVGDSESQGIYGVTPLLIRTENEDEIHMQSAFHPTRAQWAQNTANRALFRQRFGLDILTMIVHPGLVLLEPGDTPLLYTKDHDIGGKRMWVVGLSYNLKSEDRRVTLRCEVATHLDGKYTKWQTAPYPTVTTIWNGANGYVGLAGQERLGWWGATSDTVQLDVLGNNDGNFDDKVGTPDQFGQFVESYYLWW